MNVRQTIELTGIVSQHSPNLIEAAVPLPRAALERYRQASELRAKCWLGVLDELPRQVPHLPAKQRPLVWRRIEPLLIDVLVGGMIARVWGAVLTAWARSCRNTAGERIAREALIGQLEAHQKVLRLMIDAPDLALERVVALDQVRRRIERWTDVFVGHLIRRHALADFAFDVDRALDFGDEQVRESWGPRRERIWDLYFLCLRSAFGNRHLPKGAHAERHGLLWTAILGCFPRDHFLDDGMLKSVRLRRLLDHGAS